MRKKILVVDDEPDIAKVLLQRLKEHGYEATSESDALDALIHLKDHPVDLIILDIMMPEISGVEFAQKLKENKNTRDIPIIFLSALLSKKEEETMGTAIGGHTIFAKPFEMPPLLKKMEELLVEK